MNKKKPVKIASKKEVLDLEKEVTALKKEMLGCHESIAGLSKCIEILTKSSLELLKQLQDTQAIVDAAILKRTDTAVATSQAVLELAKKNVEQAQAEAAEALAEIPMEGEDYALD